MRPAVAGLCLGALVLTTPANAQQLDLSHGGPIDITARDGIEWRQNEQQVIARGDARAIRGGVTVTADRLTAWYRKKGGAATTEPSSATPVAGLAGDPSTEGNEVYRLQADGRVHIFTATDQAQGDRATYDLDQSVLVMTGKNLKLTTPNDTITSRDDLEYWPQKHMAVARGDAVVVTTDAKRVAADTLVAYTSDNSQPAPTASSTAARVSTPANQPQTTRSISSLASCSGWKLSVNVSVRTPTDTVTGDRGVYVPGHRAWLVWAAMCASRAGQNQLNGAEADVNMKTGIATLVAQKAAVGQKADRVHGLVVPNDESSRSLGNTTAATPPDGCRPSLPQPRSRHSAPAASGQKP